MKDAIILYEYIKNRGWQVNGFNVEVSNVKHKGDFVYADIELTFDDRTEKYYHCEYPLTLIKKYEQIHCRNNGLVICPW